MIEQRKIFILVIVLQMLAISLLFHATRQQKLLPGYSWLDDSSVMLMGEKEEDAIIQGVLQHIDSLENNKGSIYYIYEQTSMGFPKITDYAGKFPLPCVSFRKMNETSRMLRTASLQYTHSRNKTIFLPITQKEMEEAFKGTGDGWNILRKRHLACVGLIDLSRPGMNAVGDIAILNASISCGEHVASGTLYKLQKRNGAWCVQETYVTWKTNSWENAPHPR